MFYSSIQRPSPSNFHPLINHITRKFSNSPHYKAITTTLPLRQCTTTPVLQRAKSQSHTNFQSTTITSLPSFTHFHPTHHIKQHSYHTHLNIYSKLPTLTSTSSLLLTKLKALPKSTSLTSTFALTLKVAPLINLSTSYFASRPQRGRGNKEEWDDDEGPTVDRRHVAPKLTDEERFERREQIKFKKEEKKQFYRSNDGMWTSGKKQAHRAEIVRDHFRAEETFKVSEYNDYVRELRATRRVNVLEHKDKKLKGEIDSEDEEERDPFPSNKVDKDMERDLAGINDERDKQAIYLKYEQRQEDEMTKRMIWLACIIMVVFVIPWDSRNPDLPF